MIPPTERPMRRQAIVIAPNAFKESLTAAQAAEAMARGVRTARPDAEIVLLPLSDGGPGFLDALTREGLGATMRETVTGPLGEPVTAQWGLRSFLGRPAAVIEMAQAAGMELLPPERRDPMRTTTFGVGQLMQVAIHFGVDFILVGLGGSATCDGGIGMAQALGFRFLDEEGGEIPAPAAGRDLARVAKIVAPPEAPHVKVMAACDVNSPLVGPRGAARVYAAQKGATPAQVKNLEAGMGNFADVIARDLAIKVRSRAGAGAAGGLGAGLMAFARATLERGAALVCSALKLQTHLSRAALVITGEGAVNEQTPHGKAPWEVFLRARRRKIPTLMLAGDISEAPDDMRADPQLHLRATAPAGTPREESMREAARFLEAATREAVAEILR
jgi:glycerate kinase